MNDDFGSNTKKLTTRWYCSNSYGKLRRIIRLNFIVSKLSSKQTKALLGICNFGEFIIIEITTITKTFC